MASHRSFVPGGVIPAALLQFHEDLSIDEASYRAHLRELARVEGLAALTTNAHASEVAACTFDEQRRVLDITQDEVSARIPFISGVYADGSLEIERIRLALLEAGLLSDDARKRKTA